MYHPLDALFRSSKRARIRGSKATGCAARPAGTGAFPPINVFQQGDNLVAILELAGVNKAIWTSRPRTTPSASPARRQVAYPEGASVHRRERDRRDVRPHVDRADADRRREASKPSTAMAFWRSSSRARRATSRAPSASTNRSLQRRQTMSPQELQVQQKRELEKKQEATIPARTFVPIADIFETEAVLDAGRGNAWRRQEQRRCQC